MGFSGRLRLSLNSIQDVFRLCQPSKADTSLILRAKLALILSLLTGRSVTELTAPCFSQNTDQNNDPQSNDVVRTCTDSVN